MQHEQDATKLCLVSRYSAASAPTPGHQAAAISSPPAPYFVKTLNLMMQLC